MSSYKMSDNYNYSDTLAPHGVLNGVPVLPQTTPEHREEMKAKFNVRPDSDIFIVTYPKSGTTWMQVIIREMLYGNDSPEFAKMKLTHRMPWTDVPEDMKMDELESWPSPRTFKCHHHTPEEMDEIFFKGNRTAKIIYVMRDPRDVAVSLNSHIKSIGFSQFVNESTFDEFHKKFMRNHNEVFYGLWERHVDNWMSKRDEYNILTVKYEDMIEDTAREVKRVADFVGANISLARCEEIAKETSFSSCKKKESEITNDGTGLVNSLLRKGVVGDWVNYFQDQKEAELMEKITEEVYQKHGL